MKYGKGDDGMTELFGGVRVWKDSLRVECYGEVDELSSLIGLTTSLLEPSEGDVAEVLRAVQEKLFRASAELATPEGRDCPVAPIERRDVEELEQFVSKYEIQLRPLRHFVYPGGATAASCLHVLRAVARRVERRIVALSKAERVNENMIPFFNRLSTLFFVLAREVNRRRGIEEDLWLGRSIR